MKFQLVKPQSSMGTVNDLIEARNESSPGHESMFVTLESLGGFLVQCCVGKK